MGEKTKVLTNEGLEVYHEGIKKYIEETANIYINPDEESDTIDEDITTIPAKYVSYDNATSELEATNVQSAIDEVSSVLGTKPENVSELFSFNKYNGDISTLAVGMYAYHTGSTYTGNGSTASNGGYGGWGKILSIDTTTGYCNISSEGFFAMNSNITTRWVKAENFDFILTSTEAEYIGELVSIWGANNGGLDEDYAREYSLQRYASPSITIGMGASALVTAVQLNTGYKGAWLFFTDKTTGSVKYKEIFDEGLAESLSGQTFTVTGNSGSPINLHVVYF